ncbi:MAG: LysE family transporter [Syntrophomonadaceae bacterium]
MEIALLLTSAFVIGLSGAIMPGPLLTATIASSAQHGFKAGPLMVLGHGLLELLLIIALVFGLSQIVQIGLVSKGIALLGGSVLLYLGYIMCRDAISGRVSWDGVHLSEAGRDKGLHPIAAGIIISLVNPFWSLWWMTIGLSYLMIALKHGIVGLTAFFTGHIGADLLWYSAIAAVVAGGKRFIKPRVYQGVIILCGLFMLLFGSYFIIHGLKA